MREINNRVDSAAIPSIVGIASGKISLSVEKRAIKLVEFENQRWLYVLMLPLMWLLTGYVMAKKAVYKLFGAGKPKTNTVWFDGLGLSCRKIKEGAASWQALDIIYNHRFGQKKGLCGFVDDFWIGMMNAQAVRNRFKIAKQEIKEAILSFGNQREIRLLSLAAGSAQAVIEAISELRMEGFASAVKVLLVDTDDSALEYARELANRRKVGTCFSVCKRNVFCVKKTARDFRPHIIEMIGLLDYLCDSQAERLIKRIQRSLPEKGMFLTCNICPNRERHFLKWVIDWTMVYRAASQLAAVFNGSGFKELRFAREPLQMHCLVIARK